MGFVTLIAIIFVSSANIAGQDPSSSGWLLYEPSVVELRGKLTIADEFGPPGFGENPKNDKRVRVPILELSQPVRVRGDAGSEINSQSEDNVQRIQLVFPAGLSYKKLIGREVIVAGTLFHSHTGHHYTKVLMKVARSHLSAKCGEALHQELVRLQKETGLTLVEVNATYDGVDFQQRSPSRTSVNFNGKLAGPGVLSRDGQFVALRLSRKGPDTFYLGTARSDGSAFREYPDLISPGNFCWSHDKSKLVVSLAGRGQPMGILSVLDLDSGERLEIAANAAATPQCWSPDDSQVVYSVDSGIRIFSLNKKESRELAKGRFPTWSPDGERIAFYNGDGYYTIRPASTDRSLLFKRSGIRSGLLWAPDSRIVAYLGVGGKYPKGTPWGIKLAYSPREIRFRCLSDGSEDSMFWDYDVYYIPELHWVSQWQPIK